MSETPGPSAEQCWLNEDCVAGNHHAGDCLFEVGLTAAEERLLAVEYDLSRSRAEVERLTTALAEAERPCRHTELPDTLWHRLNQAEQERDEWRDLARGSQSEKVASAAELADLRAQIEALAEHWASCWCAPQMAPNHDPRHQDCPQHGDEAAAYFSEGFVSTLRALLAEDGA